MVLKNPWGWQQFGKCGKHVSKLLPHIGSCVDDIAFIHSMVSTSNVHGPATYLQATGFALPGFPAMGSWVSYGLGNLTDNLPSFVVLPDNRGYPPNGPANWGAGFLPASHQGTMVRPTAHPPIFDLFPPAKSFVTREGDADSLAALNKLNKRHAASRPGDSRLEARINGYELAAKLQLSAPEVLDLSRETEATRRLYGLDRKETEEFGRNCLITRRLLERGVRFVQLWSGADNGIPRRNWDSHENILQRPRRNGHQHGQAHRGAASRTEAARHARRHDHHVDHGVWPDALHGRRGRPRPQSVRVHHLAGRRRDQGRHQLRRQRRMVVQGWRRSRRPATTFTRRCCTCWASTMRN